MKVGDLVTWPQGFCDVPGIVLERKLANKLEQTDATFSSQGYAVLVMMNDLGNDPEWFHERELEMFSVKV